MTDQELRLECDKAMKMLDEARVPRTRAGQQMPLSDRVYWLIHYGDVE
jgi:hypothetical protein